MILDEIKVITDNIQINLPFSQYKTGKLIRSKLGILLLKAFEIDIKKEHLSFLTAIELIHNASLLHDDVIDNERIRRNSETINSRFNNKTAILYGNLILSNAIDLILNLNNVKLIELVNKTVQNMCQGELEQLSQIKRIPTLKEYLNKTKLKTATLFECLVTGLSILTNQDLPKEFGINFGLAFQIKNDLDDYKHGIENSKDISNQIYTAPVIFAKEVKFDENAIEKTLRLIDNYSQRAISSLNCLKNNEYKDAIIEVIKCLLN